MNQKELLDKKLQDYHFYRGSVATCFSIAITLLPLSFFIFQLSFKMISLGCLILILFNLFDIDKLNLKWTANYKPKEEIKGRKTK